MILIILQNTNGLIIDNKIVDKMNRLPVLLGKRIYYIKQYKSIYFEHLKVEYNLIKKVFPNVDITPQARIKSEKSYYDKAVKKIFKDNVFKDIYDIFGNRYIVNSVNGSTAEKDIIPVLYLLRDFLAYSFSDMENVQERLKDYIKHPKDFNYQSLHLTRFHKNPNYHYCSETQLRSYSMHCNAHSGPSSHSMFYKERVPGCTIVPTQIEYVLDENGFCLEVREKPFEKAFEDFFGIPYNPVLYSAVNKK